MITASRVLADWNLLNDDVAVAAILPCCGSTRWAQDMVSARPFSDEQDLSERSDAIWLHLSPQDWDEAFRSHPRIGERKAAATASRKSTEWSQQEQSRVEASSSEVLAALARGNHLYEEHFGRIFLVCASGKSSAEILEILERRLMNDAQTELREAVEQQRQIIRLRLRKWLGA
ncbi:2-oxo-4-hydroxy-4-carboxy-5-ureidoimidazoline decarboxylase [Alloacidobacterium dinghuense]|uniref:2-oxo-4-hydroxy-4-carboxy-5-ureidoimidazoline decarboxylase n=1 Tax=Alloacidobacterium dinghuense TaxID=2763107 RepID=A0A7G8BJZ7_9BACT|nr:2-oxo-4-hydroxy-4-carboxy-5-ureidoimidazoline decarboxylase [Alloacidobacterium dinghuense]QNI32867.1 2-oxo-4-hydroxy-4-carboxy-5-ureidoimidazoline decarboxylase [Alloacidobacterium dinghuense]